MDRHATERHWWLGKRIVTIGGGTGPFALLSSLKRYPCAITAIVTMADSGGSSRRLMDEFGQLPFGDLRQALVALSRKGALWRDVFAFRFHQTNGIAMAPAELDPPVPAADTPAGVTGHSLGNLVISALQEINHGDLLMAIQDAQELLDTAGDVLPVTLDHATLCATLENGDTLEGETYIDTRGVDHADPLPAIQRLYLREPAAACPQALRAIRRADAIIIGPGDLYTSILPNLLVDGIAESIRAAEGVKIYVCNLMTKHGETNDYKASDFVETVHHYLGGRVDRVIVNDGPFAPEILERYARKNQRPVEVDRERLHQIVPNVVIDHLNLENDNLVRHDPERLVKAIFQDEI